jgi:prolyl oligopeptidase
VELLPAFFNPPDPNGELPGLTARTVLVRSHDGVMVPLTILRGPGPQGSRPTILSGYGAYGTTIDAFFRADIRPWLAAGGVYAFCHTRGGGYFGRAWREAGMMQTKPNTWKDGIACAEYLVRQGITTPARLGITGVSAGGTFVGRALTERPDLFAAATIEVGWLDMVRFYRDGSGPANLDEFGSVESEPGFRGLLAMSSYHHVQPGARYPATLLYAGFNDARVTPWHAAKMAAALRHAGGAAALPGAERPVLLAVDFGTGHGAGSSTDQQENRWAATLAFFAARLGLPVR